MAKIINYLNGMLKKYQYVRTEVKNTPSYTIYEIKQKRGECQLFIKINGTGKVIPFFIHEIINDDEILNEFSLEDKKTILRLECEENNKPLYYFVGIKFCEQTHNAIFCQKNREIGKIQELSSDQLSLETIIINQCSSIDAFRIGCAYGMEKSKNHA